jgi:hypothetical protein
VTPVPRVVDDDVVVVLEGIVATFFLGSVPPAVVVVAFLGLLPFFALGTDETVPPISDTASPEAATS